MTLPGRTVRRAVGGRARHRRDADRPRGDRARGRGHEALARGALGRRAAKGLTWPRLRTSGIGPLPATGRRPTGCSCTPGFTFADAAVVPYLAELGVSHLYCSPVLQAAPGSTHGYDVVDHTRGLDRPRRATQDSSARVGRPRARARHRGRRRAQPHGIPEPEHLNAPALGRAAARPGVGVRGLVRRRLGAVRGEARSAGARRRRRRGAGLRRADARRARGRPGDPLLRPRVPVAPGTGGGDVADRTGPAALRARLLAREGRHAELPTVLRRRHADRGPRRARRRLRRDATPCCSTCTPRGVVDGLRIDHPDGLADPDGYLDRLRDATGGALGRRGEDPRARRVAARDVAVAGHDRLRRLERDPDGCSSTRPEAGAATELWQDVGRRPSRCARRRARRQAPGRARRCWPPRSTA